jgi:hypothetical protein
MTASLSRYLKDFSAPPTMPMPVTLASDDFASAFSFDDALPQEPQIDVDAIRAEAFSEGREAGEAAVRAEWQSEREALEMRHAEELADLRQRLEQDAAHKIEDELTSAVDRIAATLADQTAFVLAPVMQEALAERAVLEMAEMIKAALTSHNGACLTVRGPVRLYEILKDALGDAAPELRHIETPDLDISVDIDEAVLVTRLSAWAGSLKKVLA